MPRPFVVGVAGMDGRVWAVGAIRVKNWASSVVYIRGGGGWGGLAVAGAERSGGGAGASALQGEHRWVRTIKECYRACVGINVVFAAFEQPLELCGCKFDRLMRGVAGWVGGGGGWFLDRRFPDGRGCGGRRTASGRPGSRVARGGTAWAAAVGVRQRVGVVGQRL